MFCRKPRLAPGFFYGFLLFWAIQGEYIFVDSGFIGVRLFLELKKNQKQKGEKMAVKQIKVHFMEIEDKPGSLQGLLSQAASEGVDFQCFAAFSAGGGKGVVYLSAKEVGALESCAAKAGLSLESAAGFIISGEDKVGAASEALKSLAEAGVSGIAGAAMVCDGQYQMLVVVSEADAGTAASALCA